ncbi:MAG TPA: lysophospholipid acyltransferase family protein [Acidiferrobacterales bacterium]|nr:lysophospholipid acyltransferase family protein [Acidiferrobacterales bacterium]
MKRMVYLFARFVVFPLIRVLFVRRVAGIECLPTAGPYIIAANHSSYMDHFLLAAVVRKHRGKKLYFLTRKEAFEGYWSNLWHLATGCVPVDRASPEIASFRTMVGLLKRGDIVVVYPEGTRSADGQPLPPKPGVIRIALHAAVPVIPIGINGAHKILPKGRLLPRPARATLTIGESMDVNRRVDDPKSKGELERELNHLMDEIYRLAATRGPGTDTPPATLAPAVSE